MILAKFKQGKIHAVYAAGGPEEGSLYCCFTICGVRIWEPKNWEELAECYFVTCKKCQRIIGQDKVDYNAPCQRWKL